MKNKTTTAIQKSRESEKELPELLRLEKERDEAFTTASVRHKNHPSEETLAKLKSLEGANDAYRSGIRQGKIEVIQTITTSQKDIFSALIEDLEEKKKKDNSQDSSVLQNIWGFNSAIDEAQDIIRKAMEV